MTEPQNRFENVTDEELLKIQSSIEKKEAEREAKQERIKRKLEEYRRQRKEHLKQELKTLYFNENDDPFSEEYNTFLKYNPIDLYCLTMKELTDIPDDFILMSIIAILGYCLTPKVVHRFNHSTLRHNIFACFLGRTWLTRRTTSIKKVVKLANDDPLIWTDFPIPDSTEAIADGFESTEVFKTFERSMAMMIIDEMGWWLSSMKGKKHLTGMMDRICKIYDCDSWSRVTKTHGVEMVDHPYACIISATTPVRFNQLTSKDDVGTGFLPRFLIFFEERKSDWIPKESHYDFEFIDTHGKDYPDNEYQISEALYHQLRTLILSCLLFPEPYIHCQFNEVDALPLFQQFEQDVAKKVIKMTEEHEGNPLIDFIGRYSSQYVVKIADILSIADNLPKFIKNLTNVIFNNERKNEHIVDKKYLEQAMGIIDRSLQSLERLLLPKIQMSGRDEFPELNKRLLKYLYRNRNDETKLDTPRINKGMYGILKKDLEEALDTLESMEFIENFRSETKIRGFKNRINILYYKITKNGMQQIYQYLDDVDKLKVGRPQD